MISSYFYTLTNTTMSTCQDIENKETNRFGCVFSMKRGIIFGKIRNGGGRGDGYTKKSTNNNANNNVNNANNVNNNANNNVNNANLANNANNNTNNNANLANLTANNANKLSAYDKSKLYEIELLKQYTKKPLNIAQN